MIRHPIQLIVLQPTALCNLNCRYCYVPDRRSSSIMQASVLERFFYLLSRSKNISENVTLVWHSGEPMALKLEFYEIAISLQKKYGFQNRISHHIQTNGTLISDKWCDFFKRNNFKIHLSIDGPKKINDYSRIDWSGKGSFDRVMKGIRCLKDNDIPLKALAVVTEQTFFYPDEFFYFFLENGFTYLGLNIEEKIGSNKLPIGLNNECSDTYQSYLSFLKRLFFLWKNHHKEIYIREFSKLVSFMKHKKMNSEIQHVQFQNQLLSILSIRKDGAISGFSPELVVGTEEDKDAFIYEHVALIDSFDELFQNKKMLTHYNQIQAGQQMCRVTCPYFDFCGGGTPSSKIYENNSFESSETNYCIKHRKLIIDTIMSSSLSV